MKKIGEKNIETHVSQVTCRLFDKLASGEKIDQAQAKVFFESLLNELGFDHVTISDELV